jgi:hypothetical protein
MVPPIGPTQKYGDCMLHRFVNPNTLLTEINDLLSSSYTNVIDGSLALLQNLTSSTLTTLDDLVNLWLVDLTGQTGPTEDLLVLYLDTSGPLEISVQSALDAQTLFADITVSGATMGGVSVTISGDSITFSGEE